MLDDVSVNSERRGVFTSANGDCDYRKFWAILDQRLNHNNDGPFHTSRPLLFCLSDLPSNPEKLLVEI